MHRLANLRAKLPDEVAGEVLAHVYAVRDAPTLDAGRASAERFVGLFGREYPAAVARFQDDLEALLAIHRVPVRHRIRVRTTNLAERSFEEERRRTKVIPRLRTEQAAIKLVFATMMRAAERWTRVSVTTSSVGNSSSCEPSSDWTRHRRINHHRLDEDNPNAQRHELEPGLQESQDLTGRDRPSAHRHLSWVSPIPF